MKLWSKDIIAKMISGPSRKCNVVRLTPGMQANVLQIVLRPTDHNRREEPFPGLTDEVSEFLQTDEIIGILDFVEDKPGYVIDLIVKDVPSTHEKEETQ